MFGSDKVYTQEDLDAAVAKAVAGAVKVPADPPPPSLADAGAKSSGVLVAAASRSAFYHLYVCVQDDCYDSPNPQKQSQHQRGLHTFESSPLPLVLCPGCKKPMQIGKQIQIERVPRAKAEDGYEEKQTVTDLIYAAPGQEDAAKLDEALIAGENAVRAK